MGAFIGMIFMMCLATFGLGIMAFVYNKEKPMSFEFVKLKVRKFGKRRTIVARCGLRWLKLKAYRLSNGQYQCVTIGEDSFKTYGFVRKAEKKRLFRAVTDRVAMDYPWLQMIEIIDSRGGQAA